MDCQSEPEFFNLVNDYKKHLIRRLGCWILALQEFVDLQIRRIAVVQGRFWHGSSRYYYDSRNTIAAWYLDQVKTKLFDIDGRVPPMALRCDPRAAMFMQIRFDARQHGRERTRQNARRARRTIKVGGWGKPAHAPPAEADGASSIY
jgi:hypothetical protein